MPPEPHARLMAEFKTQHYIADALEENHILKVCDVSILPDLVFVVGNGILRIPAAYYVSEIRGICHINISKSDAWYVGVPFFRSHRVTGNTKNAQHGNNATVTIIPSDNPSSIKYLPQIVANIDQYSDVCIKQFPCKMKN